VEKRVLSIERFIGYINSLEAAYAK